MLILPDIQHASVHTSEFIFRVVVVDGLWPLCNRMLCLNLQGPRRDEKRCHRHGNTPLHAVADLNVHKARFSPNSMTVRPDLLYQRISAG